MNTNHTPGPWKAYGSTVYQHDKWVDGNNLGSRQIARCYPDHQELPDACPSEEDAANARLIALACNCHDDLLSACKSILEHLQASDLDKYHEESELAGQEYDDIKRLKAAITKATGGQA